MIYENEGYTEEFLEVRRKYRNCFTQHPEVLEHLLTELGLFQDIPSDPAAVALRNYGMRLLDIIGANDESNIRGVVRMYLNVPYAHNKKKDSEEEL